MSQEAARDASPATETPLYCVNHPKTETLLRCNKCGSPICTKCAIRTPVGFRCPQCVRNQQAAFYTATALDYGIALAVAFFLSLIAGLIMGQLGWFFAIFLGPLAGGLIAEATHRAIGRRRGRWIPILVVVCLVGGALLPALPTVVTVLTFVLASPAAFQSNLLFRLLSSFNIVYVVLAAITAYSRLK